MTPTDEELEAAYEKALAEFKAGAEPRTSIHRYFFWAGVEYERSRPIKYDPKRHSVGDNYDVELIEEG